MKTAVLLLTFLILSACGKQADTTTSSLTKPVSWDAAEQNAKIEVHFVAQAQIEQHEACFGTEFQAQAFPATQYIPLCWYEPSSSFQAFKFDIQVNNLNEEEIELQLIYRDAIGCYQTIEPIENRIPALSQVSVFHGESSLPVNQNEYIIAVASEKDAMEFESFNSCSEETPFKNYVDNLIALKASGKASIQKRHFKTIVNPTFANEAAGIAASAPREYTIADFDIRPYLPNDASSALYKVLFTAQTLTGDSQRDGIGYKQHTWSKDSDEENLAIGIDCSRAIWYAFTRSKLPYSVDELGDNDSKQQPYMATADMVNESSKLSHQFMLCDSDAPRLGDVLVYRRDETNTGHVVMVIDPEQRIAWGSHGWDGNGLMPEGVPDVGAEYQLIKKKQDWQAWDRRSMTLRACWRYKGFKQNDFENIGDFALKNCDKNLDQCQPTL